MSVHTIHKQEGPAGLEIPDYLIYELVKGKPIYYKGYREVLNKTKTFEETRMESTLQAYLKAYVSSFLINLFGPKGIIVFTGELGLNLPNKTKRGADIALYKKELVSINEHFSNIPPEAIIEIDVQADTADSTEMDYVLEKIQDYLDFGVKEVYWIFTKKRKVMVATPTGPWLTHDWTVDLHILNEAKLNLEKLVPAEKI